MINRHGAKCAKFKKVTTIILILNLVFLLLCGCANKEEKYPYTTYVGQYTIKFDSNSEIGKIKNKIGE